MKRILLPAMVAGSFVASGAAYAGTATANMPVQMVIAASCTVSAATLNFGTQTLIDIGSDIDTSANLTVTCTAAAGCGAINWAPGSTAGRGQTVYFSTVTTKTINLLAPNSMYGEGHTEIDLKVAKVFRFAGTRANVGVDIYNLLNTDAITNYNQTFTPTATNAWLTPTNLVQPRFARLQVQFDF